MITDIQKLIRGARVRMIKNYFQNKAGWLATVEGVNLDEREIFIKWDQETQGEDRHWYLPAFTSEYFELIDVKAHDWEDLLELI